MSLSREEVIQKISASIAAQALEPIDVPQLGGAHFLRILSAGERARIATATRIKRGPRQGEVDAAAFSALMAVRCLVDKDGKRVLTDEDADLVSMLPSGVLDTINNTIQRISGISEEGIEEVKKPSEPPAASDGSSSS